MKRIVMACVREIPDELLPEYLAWLEDSGAVPAAAARTLKARGYCRFQLKEPDGRGRVVTVYRVTTGRRAGPIGVVSPGNGAP